MIENRTLSDNGFTVTPELFFRGISPIHGLDLCSPNILRYSPAPKIIGYHPDLPSFGEGEDINVGGVLIKPCKSRVVVVPLELQPFYNVIRRCVSNEFAIDPDAEKRRFLLTITRCNVDEGNASMPRAGHWHKHLPSERLDRAQKIQANRNYVIADLSETEFLVRSTDGLDPSDKSLTADYKLPLGALGAFASPSLHRSPILSHAGRRTALIFLSHAINSEDPYSGNPMISKLAKASSPLKQYLMSRWLECENILLGHADPMKRAVSPTAQVLQLVT